MFVCFLCMLLLQVVLALNRFISVQMQGLSACTMAAVYASNSSNGCVTNPPIPANFCASPNAMNVPVRLRSHWKG